MDANQRGLEGTGDWEDISGSSFPQIFDNTHHQTQELAACKDREYPGNLGESRCSGRSGPWSLVWHFWTVAVLLSPMFRFCTSQVSFLVLSNNCPICVTHNCYASRWHIADMPNCCVKRFRFLWGQALILIAMVRIE